ncbi:hypothetical protein LJC63_06275 [Ruminococcaceae bacterium OttesenSCG-928-L11]|nr:hypothetical protein [Ruminococcaceae bacterium OttesenSCG-928-L11]
MKLKEMQSCAADTLDYFIAAMPDVPFGVDDIHIEFTTKSKIVERFKALCSEYAPDRPINEHHEFALEHNNFGNAIIGRGKSAVLLKTDYTIDEQDLRRIVFHELTHIYCGKTEMDDEHFIDVFGSGHTPDLDPEDKTYDGYVSAGYFVWSEFIAEYTAISKTIAQEHGFADIADNVIGLLCEIVIGNPGSKYIFAMMSAYILTCADARDILPEINTEGFIIPDNSQDGMAAVTALQSCLLHLHEHMQTQNPWKITEDFIASLGEKYLIFLMMNSIYLGAI